MAQTFDVGTGNPVRARCRRRRDHRLGCRGDGAAVRTGPGLISTLDDAASTRAQDITTRLQFDRPADLDSELFGTNQRITLVQVIDPTAGGADIGPPTPAPRRPTRGHLPEGRRHEDCPGGLTMGQTYGSPRRESPAAQPITPSSSR